MPRLWRKGTSDPLILKLPRLTKTMGETKTKTFHKLGITINLNMEEHLLGVANKNEANTNQVPIASESKMLITILSLLTKHYIHLCKCTEEQKSTKVLQGSV